MKKIILLNVLFVFLTIVAYGFVDQEGRAFDINELKNKSYLSAFIFTNCVSTCPLIINDLKNIKKTKKYKNIPVYLFTVDPDRDTYVVLKKFWSKHKLTKEWKLITGEKNKLLNMIRDFFLVPIGQSSTKDEIMHSDVIIFTKSNGKSEIVIK